MHLPSQCVCGIAILFVYRVSERPGGERPSGAVDGHDVLLEEGGLAGGEGLGAADDEGDGLHRLGPDQGADVREERLGGGCEGWKWRGGGRLVLQVLTFGLWILWLPTEGPLS